MSWDISSINTYKLLKAKKHFGQHFLRDQQIIVKIAESIVSVSGGMPVLEIGPGKGALSDMLIESGVNLQCVELDDDMIRILKVKHPKLRIIQSDVLEINPHEVEDGKAFVLCGNYPYNISSQILFWMLSARDIIPEMIGMFQYEVADRIVSGPGSRKYGILSVLCQAFYDCQLLFEVPPESFTPEPKVNSAVIRLTRNKVDKLECDEKYFKRVVKTAFNQRRKKLSNSLKGLAEDRTIFDNDIFTKRPEHLSVTEFIEITNILNT